MARMTPDEHDQYRDLNDQALAASDRGQHAEAERLDQQMMAIADAAKGR